MPKKTLGSNAGGNKAIAQLGRVSSLDEIVTASQSKSGQDKTREIIFSHGGPTYSADPETPTLLLERSADGTIRRGCFRNRIFVPVAAA